MRYVRQKDNPLLIKAWAFTVHPGHVCEFDPETYEEVEGELPDGWQLEPKPRTAASILNELQQLFEAAELSVQYTFLTPMSGVTAAAQRGNIPLMRYIIEQENVPPELEEVKQIMLSLFEEVS